MDSIDRDIRDLYKQNTKLAPRKFMAVLLSVVSINAAIAIISFYEKSIFIKIALELTSGILMVSFFLWFFFKIYKK